MKQRAEQKLMYAEMLCPHCGSAKTMVVPDSEAYLCNICKNEFTPVIPVTSLRIFLSYGHDANEELVCIIKADLEKRGHDVWFDKTEIRPGNDWRRSITDGIIESDRFVSFLSKYSTRDPGVCLDEIAIAIGVKGGNIQTILVESESEVKPPPSISHIQWLDMHEWKERCEAGKLAWDEWYQAKLADIVVVVESDESRRFAGEIKTLEDQLKPTVSDFITDVRIRKLLEKKLVGRTWLFEAVEKWRNTFLGESRLFWLMGAPGIGKSAFAAHLAHEYGQGTVIAVHFCDWKKPDHRDACRIIRTLAFQIAARLPDYRKLLLTLPIMSDLDQKNAAELFDGLLTTPLRLSIIGGRERYLIVIDGLDEAGGDGHNELVEVFARYAEHLPNWIGLVVTSRQEFDVTTPFQALKPFPFEAKSEANNEDIRAYLRLELAAQLQSRLNADWIVEQILEKSEGVFLYVESFCEDIRKGYLSLDRPNEFPQGLAGKFIMDFQRYFPDLEKFRKDVRPALRAILAACEPLPTDILQRLFNWQDEELNDFTHPLASLFPISGEADHEVIKPYHKALIDWLTDKKKAGAFFVSLREGHLALVEFACSQFARGIDKLDNYYLGYLPTHFAELEQWEELVNILCCKDYVEAAVNQHPTRQYTLILDFRNALIHSSNTQLEKLWEAPVVCALFALKAIGSLVDQGELNAARSFLQNYAATISQRDIPELTSTLNCLLGRLAIYAGDRHEAEARLAQAFSVARDAGYHEGVAKALLGIGVSIRKFGGEECDAEDELNQALKTDYCSFDTDHQARVLLNLAMVNICKGRPKEAGDCLDGVCDLIEQNDYSTLHPWLCKYKGFLWLLCYDFKQAADQFHLAAELFAKQGHVQEQLRCEDLLFFALGPKAFLYARELIDRASVTSLPMEQRFKFELEIQKVMDLTRGVSAVPSESDAEKVANATRQLIDIIQELEIRLDPEPPAKCIR